MKLFSFSQANHLISYYTDKMIGRNISADSQLKIKGLGKEDYGGDKYKVNAYVIDQRGAQVRKNIEDVATYLGLLTPSEVLAGQYLP